MIYVKQKQQQTQELNFLHNFKSTDFFDNLVTNDDFGVSFVEEPFTGFGYPDLVCLIWDKKIKSAWAGARNKLIINDIKILQHLYNKKSSWQTIERISKVLGFSKRDVEKSSEKLSSSELIDIKEEKLKIKDLKDIFFLKEIITIEAKLKDWRRAMDQAINNTYFSSEVYALFPKKIINDNLVENYQNTDVGIISFEQDYNIIKQPKKKNIPINLNSWLLNELIGREVCQTN